MIFKLSGRVKHACGGLSDEKGNPGIEKNINLTTQSHEKV
jgi:hypothetical protein